MPVEPPPSPWSFPAVSAADDWGVVAVGGDLEPGTILAAYRAGLFPMPLGGAGPLGWWSPDPRGILEIDRLRVSRSLGRSCRRFEIRIDTAFAGVVAACAAPTRPGGWIDSPVQRAYERLHQLGWAHSIEAWAPDGRLAGGLYGVAIGGLFAAESKFFRERDASKVALVALVDLLRSVDVALLDVQWTTPHLASLGATAIPRTTYLERLEHAVAAPLPHAFAQPAHTARLPLAEPPAVIVAGERNAAAHSSHQSP